MTRKFFFSALILLLSGGLSLAGADPGKTGGRNGNGNGNGHVEVSIGICEPESDDSALGWDQDPTEGNWGGRWEVPSTFAVVWEPDDEGGPDVPANEGREAECTIPGVNNLWPSRIEVEYLQGLANDDFCLFVDFAAGEQRLGCVDERDEDRDAPEEWATVSFTIPPAAGNKGQDITVKILATGNAWSGRGTYGQLAVDSIEVFGSHGKPK